MSDVIVLRGLRLLGTHGVLEEERHRAQPFEFDLELRVDLAEAGANDDLASTLDYGAVLSLVEAIVTGERFALLEALAQTVAARLLDRFGRLESVVVSVRKLRPPVAVDLVSAGVRIERFREQAGA
ncbi:MAG: dihydroneopterin aldolase [Actinomycetota bacterium]|nr:dihydroneopterin aldolase [Actinomycetota bacterium]